MARQGVSESGNATRALSATCTGARPPGPLAPGGRLDAFKGLRVVREGYFWPLSGCTCFAFAIASATSFGM